MSRRRDSWSIPALPGVLRAQVKDCEATMQRLRHHIDVLGDSDTRQASLRLIQQERNLLADPDLPLFWVTEPMAQVALDASQDIPTVSPTGAPVPAGFMGVAAGLPPLPPAPGVERIDTTGQPILEPIVPAAFLWHTTTEAFRVAVFAHSSEMPGRRKLNSGGGHLHELAGISIRRTPEGQWPNALDGDPSHLGVLSWLAAAWHLMQMPTGLLHR